MADISIITNLDILLVVREKAKKELPDFKNVLIQLEPKGVKRPALLIQTVTDTTRDANRSLVEKTVYATLTVFGTTDNYYQSGTIELLDLQNKVADLFRDGYLRVKGHLIKVTANTAGFEWEKAYVEIAFEYVDIRTEKTETLPLMEIIETEVEVVVDTE